MMLWREALFTPMKRNAESIGNLPLLPHNGVVELGTCLQICCTRIRRPNQRACAATQSSLPRCACHEVISACCENSTIVSSGLDTACAISLSLAPGRNVSFLPKMGGCECARHASPLLRLQSRQFACLPGTGYEPNRSFWTARHNSSSKVLQQSSQRTSPR